ncbi:MAG: hypothetical protein L6Q71_07925, partial [Planctomycetes bacterium]|nr:hypothetical protein [Planctomycetota bacterium]
MRYDRSFNLCGVKTKAQITPDVLREYSNARAASRDTAAQMVGALRARIKRNPTLDEIYAALKRLTYRNDPQCVDRAQSLETSLSRQKGEGVFGDCGAFAVALSALAEAAGHGPGEWVLLGDESDPAQHIVNKFGQRLIDCTPGGSANYRPRLPRQIGVDVQSGQARTFQQGQVA